MNINDRKKVIIITEYILDTFKESDWFNFGQLTGKLKMISNDGTLLDTRGFGYEERVHGVLNKIFSENPNLITDVIDYYKIKIWFKERDPEKYKTLVESRIRKSADFWTDGYLRLFISHLSKNKKKVSAMKSNFANWGISAFVAYEDIKTSLEWIEEIKVGLETMDVMVAVLQKGFKDSDWCSQEVGFALGRKVEIISLIEDLDPFGFFGTKQGIKIKSNDPIYISNTLTKTLLESSRYRNKLLQSIPKAFSKLGSPEKLRKINLLVDWSIITNQQTKSLLEKSELSEDEKNKLKNLIKTVGAFPNIEQSTSIVYPGILPF